MDRETLIFNIKRFAGANNESPSGACLAAGLSKNFVSEIKRGRMPSVSSIYALAAHLGVSVSDLVGDAKTPAELAPVAAAWAELNNDGRAEAIRYIEYLCTKPEYIKNHLSKEA